MRKLLFCALLLCASVSFAQDSTNKIDLGLWVAPGHSVPGGTSDIFTFAAGGRLGRVLTGDHLGGFLRGNLEYAIDVIPIYIVNQNGGIYGAGFDPLNLKWNFTSSQRVVPYLQLGGGTLFSSTEVPRGTSTVNFRTHASLGFHFKRHQSNNAVTLELRYEHISNAGLATPNPGINTLQYVVGFNAFRCGVFHSCKPK